MNLGPRDVVAILITVMLLVILAGAEIAAFTLARMGSDYAIPVEEVAFWENTVGMLVAILAAYVAGRDK